MKTAAVTKIGALGDPDEAKRGRIEVIDLPEQEMGDEDVKIRVAYCAICGSDPHVAEGAFGMHVPQGLGHEMSGVIESLGKNAVVKGLKIGDRVAGNFLHFCGTCYYCQNGQQQFCSHTSKRKSPCMAESVVWHESQVYKLPGGVSLKTGCLLEPVSVAVRAVDKLNPRVGSRIAVSGGGPIGQLCLQLLRLRGAVSLTLIEPIPGRRELGAAFGAEHLIDPFTQDVEERALDITGGIGYDAVLDVSGAPAAVVKLPGITAKGGTVLYGAMYPVAYEMPLNLFKYCYQNDLTFSGLFLSPYTFPRAVQLLSRLDLEPFTGVVFPIEEATEAYAAHITGKHAKVLVRCNDLD